MPVYSIPKLKHNDYNKNHNPLEDVPVAGIIWRPTERAQTAEVMSALWEWNRSLSSTDIQFRVSYNVNELSQGTRYYDKGPYVLLHISFSMHCHDNETWRVIALTW